MNIILNDKKGEFSMIFSLQLVQQKWPGDKERLERMSIIEEEAEVRTLFTMS